ncbi:hypothetical protein L1987_04122 [Smallanthus sonchifolius]|uniref:Uncharacterized protein n=1 Tax=Smallanthus sonchifolius TaxID=185202 RepID=A0ACB9KCQ9_9ASTR|nr:hypothetical protein L1987_04122 [Smallanthus sonchifolius]
MEEAPETVAATSPAPAPSPPSQVLNIFQFQDHDGLEANRLWSDLEAVDTSEEDGVDWVVDDGFLVHRR